MIRAGRTDLDRRFDRIAAASVEATRVARGLAEALVAGEAVDLAHGRRRLRAILTAGGFAQAASEDAGFYFGGSFPHAALADAIAQAELEAARTARPCSVWRVDCAGPVPHLFNRWLVERDDSLTARLRPARLASEGPTAERYTLQHQALPATR